MNAGVLAAIGSAAIWAAASTLMASSVVRVDALSVSAVRAVWGALLLVLLAPFIFFSGGFDGLTLAVVGGVIGSAIAGMALGDTLYVASLGALGLGRGFTISLGLFVLLTYVLGVILLDERITVATAVGSLLILGGVYIVALRGRQAAPAQDEGGPLAPGLARGLALVGLTALAWAVATVWLGAAAEGQNALAVGAVRLPATAALLVGIAAVVPRTSLRRRAIARRDHLAQFFAGLAGTGVGSLLFIYAVQEAGVGRSAVVTAISPLFAVPLGAIFLGERMTAWVVVGAVVAVAGIILVS